MEAASVSERLLDAATDLFADEGYDAVGVEKLRARAGVSNGSFFHLFAAKEDLAAELLVSCVVDYQAAIIARAGALRRCVHRRRRDRPHAYPLGDQQPQQGALHARRRARRMVRQGRGPAANPQCGIRARRSSAGARRWSRKVPLRDVSIEVFLATLIGPANLICRTWITGRKLSAASPARSEDELVALALAGAGDRTRAAAKARSKKHDR